MPLRSTSNDSPFCFSSMTMAPSFSPIPVSPVHLDGNFFRAGRSSRNDV
jgi:hypothetical protein